MKKKFTTKKQARDCNAKSMMYVQIPCVIPTKHYVIRRVFGLIVSAGAVFTYLFSTVYFDYLSCVQTNKYIDYDVKTITAGDYSIVISISADQYEHWKKHYKKENSPTEGIFVNRRPKRNGLFSTRSASRDEYLKLLPNPQTQLLDPGEYQN